ncbi:hypothetical protein, partial [Mesorhizobium sp. M1A.F.Ca.IN.020.06.1.1]|uniref:hypothetical protein n=1 Tax=Mesorhizobium sp. M1A.F.Ca.IN.020.06.1.1 TaxID=2496765 RepID=UPI0019D484C3
LGQMNLLLSSVRTVLAAVYACRGDPPRGNVGKQHFSEIHVALLQIVSILHPEPAMRPVGC